MRSAKGSEAAAIAKIHLKTKQIARQTLDVRVSLHVTMNVLELYRSALFASGFLKKIKMIVLFSHIHGILDLPTSR